jgi:hypothetical protein
MIEDIDIWRAAEQMRKLYGADAAIHAAVRADKLMDQSDIEGFSMWKRVVAAIEVAATLTMSGLSPAPLLARPWRKLEERVKQQFNHQEASAP